MFIIVVADITKKKVRSLSSLNLFFYIIDWIFLFRYIVSDCDAVATIHDNHKYVSKPEDAVAVALKAGTIVP